MAGQLTPRGCPAGDQVLQLYRHSKSQALPLCSAPSAAKLAEVAQLSLQRQDWDTAMAAAQDMSAAEPKAAAQVVTAIMDAVQTQGASVSAVAAGMALLHAAHQHKETVRVSLSHCIVLLTEVMLIPSGSMPTTFAGGLVRNTEQCMK